MRVGTLFLCFVFILLCLDFGVSYSSQIGFSDDVDRIAEMGDLRDITRANPNLIVVGPGEIMSIFRGTSINNVKKELPFKIRTLIRCGKCVLFYTVDRVFYAGTKTTINQLVRRPEIKRKLSNRIKRAQWFKRMRHNSRFADKPLERGWHLVSLVPKGINVRYSFQTINSNEKVAAPNLYFWMFLILSGSGNSVPQNWFYTSAKIFDKNNVVTIKVNRRGLIDVYYQFGHINITGIGILPEIKPDITRWGIYRRR